jgi:hypothetical protein
MEAVGAKFDVCPRRLLGEIEKRYEISSQDN